MENTRNDLILKYTLFYMVKNDVLTQHCSHISTLVETLSNKSCNRLKIFVMCCTYMKE